MQDILKRDFYVYKGRILLDGCEVIPIPDGKGAYIFLINDIYVQYLLSRVLSILDGLIMFNVYS